MSSKLNNNDKDIQRETGYILFFLQIQLNNSKDALESCPNNGRSSKQVKSARLEINRSISLKEMVQLIYYYHIDSSVFRESDKICS
jgi:hypothetical protein